jgi:hypothetical protein
MPENNNQYSGLEKLAVLDFDIPQLFNNKIFNLKDAAAVHHTILPTCYLYNQALAQGIRFITQDVFFSLKTKPKKVLLMSNLVTPYTKKLILAGAKPVILTCQESPFIATGFYLNLKKYSSQFKYSIVFSGMKKHLSPKTQYFQMFFPEVYNPANFKPLPFAQKKYLTMISGNKRVSNWKKNILLKLFYGFGIKEIYSLRQTIVNFFADSGKFDLYGVLWDRGGLTGQDSENIKKIYRGTVAEKLPVLSQYKFAFCLENTVFPGYITEKIFDALFAGSVPVYLGAPDIADFVPKNCFIDMRDFESLKQLDLYLSSTTEPVYQTYLNNIAHFLNSLAYAKFSYMEFNRQVINILEQEFKV